MGRAMRWADIRCRANAITTPPTTDRDGLIYPRRVTTAGLGEGQGTAQMTAARVLWRAVTVTDTGKEHGASHSRPLSRRPVSVTEAPLLSVRTAGERPEIRYRPGGRRTEKTPERSARTCTGRCPAVVKVSKP